MTEEADVARLVWSSLLPIGFRLAANEVDSLAEPDPFFTMVPRQSYLPLILDRVIQQLKPKTTAKDVWLDCDGQPLRWHLPIGVLFDLFGEKQGIPWILNIHFRDFPEDILVRCQSRAAVEAILMSALKESDALKNKPPVMAQLQKRDHQELFRGLCNNRFEQFWTINRKLVSGEFRHVPTRVHFRSTPHAQKLVSSSATLGEVAESVIGSDWRQWRLVVQGVEPPPETPMTWLGRHLAHCDNFVHVIARENH
ncbi:autophagy protein 5-like [Oppia nitens]|uniref:autophagy protein 5-like n=1 Tax=Oppia nitens TaxID=1686743 RepID=UPI0023DC6BAF|nr:autophagy protein 5-like [Oppia nitens]